MTSSAPPPPEGPSAPPPAAPPPSQPPQYTPPPPPSYAAGPVAPAERPGMVTGAGITMIVLGALITLFGLLFLLGGAILGGASGEIDAQMPGLGIASGALAGVAIVFAIILLAIGILDIVAGANVMGGRSWARITGIVLAAILGLFSLAGLGGGDQGGGIIFTLILIAANAFIIYALATSGAWFAARSS